MDYGYPSSGDRDAYAYLLWFAVAPAVSVVAAVGMVNLAGYVYPPMAHLMTGGRVSGCIALTNQQAWLAGVRQWLLRHKKPRQIPAGVHHP